jgi:hypothetical protein
MKIKKQRTRIISAGILTTRVVGVWRRARSVWKHLKLAQALKNVRM